MTIPAFDTGDMLRLGNHAGANPDETTREAFTDIEGVPTDPSMVGLGLRTPSGAELAYNWPTQGAGDGVLTQEETGRFYYDVDLTEAGLWWWSLSGSGGVATAERGAFYVRRSMV